MSERTVKDVAPFEIIRGIIELGWEVHSADLILHELDKIEAENEALQEKVLAWIVTGMELRVRLDALLTGESDGTL